MKTKPTPSDLIDSGPVGHPLMRMRRPASHTLGLRKVTVLVPESCADGLRDLARVLRARQRDRMVGSLFVWRRISLSAELMIDPGCGARCAIRDTGAPGDGRYHWTVTVFGEADPVSAGRTAELGEARSRAEAALTGRRAGMMSVAPHLGFPVTDND